LRLTNLAAFSAYKSSELDALAEAARVILWQLHDVPPPNTGGTWKHDGGEAGDVELEWSEPTRDEHAMHADEIDALEKAAYAVALAIAWRLDFVVLGRVHRGSGADWLLVPKGEPANDYYKLEVSGIDKIHPANTPARRLKEKAHQGATGRDYQRPGLAIVTRFEDVLILSESWR
jgi:hypothetical protein